MLQEPGNNDRWYVVEKTGEAAGIRINPEHPVLKDLRVRQAINMAFDRKSMIDSLYGDVAEPLTLPRYLADVRPGTDSLVLEVDPGVSETPMEEGDRVPLASTVRTRPDPAFVERFAARLVAARVPVIAAGKGIVRQNAMAELARSPEASAIGSRIRAVTTPLTNMIRAVEICRWARVTASW